MGRHESEAFRNQAQFCSFCRESFVEARSFKKRRTEQNSLFFKQLTTCGVSNTCTLLYNTEKIQLIIH